LVVGSGLVTACGHSGFDDLPLIQEGVTNDSGIPPNQGNDGGPNRGDGGLLPDGGKPPTDGGFIDGGVGDAIALDASTCLGADTVVGCPAVYVSNALGNDSNPGTPTKPVKTIGKGIDIADSNKIGKVRIGGGTYQEDVTVVDGIDLVGSFACDHSGCGWIDQSVATSPTIIKNQRSTGVLVPKDVQRPTTLSRLVIESKDGQIDAVATFGNVGIEIAGSVILEHSTVSGNSATGGTALTGRSIAVVIDGNNQDSKAPLINDCVIGAGNSSAAASIGVLLQSSPATVTGGATNAVIQDSTITSQSGVSSFGVQANSTTGSASALKHNSISSGAASGSSGLSWGVSANSPLIIDGNQIQSAAAATPSCASSNTGSFCGGLSYGYPSGLITNNWIRGISAQHSAALFLHTPEGAGGNSGTIVVNSNTLDGAGSGSTGQTISAGIALHNTASANGVATLGSVRNNILFAGLAKVAAGIYEDETVGKGAHCSALDNNDFVGAVLYHYWDQSAGSGAGAASDETTIGMLQTTITTPIPTNNIAADPQIFSGYMIPATSPCANAATTTEEPPVDITGTTTRPQGQGPDIGCYETK
jgi:hypothetical protein